jgi:hypothetical protein
VGSWGDLNGQFSHPFRNCCGVNHFVVAADPTSRLSLWQQEIRPRWKSRSVLAYTAVQKSFTPLN